MEQLFMQVFERRDWVAAQVDQQADSYSQTLACTLLANGHRPPDWLLPNLAGGPQQELNGKPIVTGLLFTGSQITTPAANRNVFFPAIPSTSIRNSEILNAYTQPVNNCGTLSTLATDEHEEPQQEQTSLSKELANCCDGANMFSRIQRSKSRQRNIEDSRRGSGQAANSGTCDGIQAVGLNKATVSSSSRSCGDVANNAETTSSCPGQANGLHASQGRSADLLKHHNNLGSQGNQLDCLSSLDLKDKIMCSDNNCSARDSQIVPLPKHSELNIADTTCHAMPGTHPLVEPKKLQFDGAESVCMGNTSEQTGPQHESALESDNCGLADRNLLREDPYTASSSQEPYSMGRSSLVGLKSDYLKSVNADLKHYHYGLESGHRDLSPMHSPNEEQSLNCSAEVPIFVADSLLRTNTLYVPETSSKVGQTQEMGSLNSDQTKCSGRSHSVVNPLLEKDIFQTIEDTNNPKSSNPKVSVPPSNGPLQLPIQLADASFEANISSRMLMNSLLGENGHNHLSNLLTDSNSRCLLGVSSVSLVQFPPQKFTSNNVCQSSPFSYGTHSNGTHSNGFTAADAFEAAENMLTDQHLSRPSLKFDGSIADADAPLGQPPPDMHNEMLIENPASEMVDCYSEKLIDDVHVNEAHDSSTGNKKDQFVAPKVISSVSSGRTRKMRETRSSVIPSEKCNGSLPQEGMEQEVPPVDNDVPINAEACTVENVELIKSSRPSVQYYLRSSVSYEKKNQLQANRKNGQKRSVADGVQVNGGTSSKTKRMKCQDITHSHSSRTNSLCLFNQDSIGSHVATAENLSGRSQRSGRYLLRSSGFNEFISLESQTKNAATNSKMSVASDVPENGDASQKPMKNIHLSDVAIYNCSSGEALSSRFSCSNGSRSAVEGMDFPNPQAQFKTNFDVAATSALPSCSNIGPDIGECYAQEENNCLEGLGSSVNVSSVKHQKMPIQTDENLILLNQEYYSGTGSLTMLPSHALDQHGKQTSGLVPSADKKLSFDSGVKLDARCENEDPSRILLTDATILRQEGDNPVDCNIILPEFECFNVSLPLDSTTTEKRAYETLCAPIRFGTLSSDISSKYKVNTVGGMHQLVATMPKNATSCSSSGDVRQYSDSVSSDDSMSITDIFGSCGLGTSGSFVPSASYSSNGSDKHVSSENPLTPAVEKYSMGKLSARVGSVSEHMGLIPELSCFRIDEDAGIGEDNECQDMLSEFVANQLQSDRIALQDITGLCQNTENSALNSMDMAKIDLTTETGSSKVNQNSGLKKDHNKKKPKESSASLVKREGKVSRSLLNRLSKTEVTDNRNQRNTSEANLGKRSKPSNIIANVSSFIPFVKPKQSTTACVKKDVRVKALEAAEAAKRLEEKKQNEREMRKAAAKLEREKMKKEKESKQKQEQEQTKKQHTDMATRKRQRDEEERRGKERKRRCAEEARKQQRQPTEKKDAHPKASDNKELQKNLVEVVRGEVKPDERIDMGNKAITSNNDIVADERPASFRSHATENIPNSLDESYVMTPYKDSDDEDYEEEASRRRKKLKPSWVREENLVKILLSDNQALDPREIFAQNCSFNLSDVLPVKVPLRGVK